MKYKEITFESTYSSPFSEAIKFLSSLEDCFEINKATISNYIERTSPWRTNYKTKVKVSYK